MRTTQVFPRFFQDCRSLVQSSQGANKFVGYDALAKVCAMLPTKPMLEAIIGAICPTALPTVSPTVPTGVPTADPTPSPTSLPTTAMPTLAPTLNECSMPHLQTCLPQCSGALRGQHQSAIVEGNDYSFGCGKTHGLFSWTASMSAGKGGYLGTDATLFFSSVNGGFGGPYVVTLGSSAGIQTLLNIAPDQDVAIFGNRTLAAQPSWGKGGFAVGERASLALSYLKIDTLIHVKAGAHQLNFNDCLLAFHSPLLLRSSVATFAGTVFLASIVVTNTNVPA